MSRRLHLSVHRVLQQHRDIRSTILRLTDRLPCNDFPDVTRHSGNTNPGHFYIQSHQRSLDSAISRPDNCTYKFQAEVSRLDNSQTSPFCTTNSTQRLWSWWVICRQFYMVLVFIIEYTLHDWVHSSWLAVLSMTDCTLHDWLQSSWSTVISITDCILHDWLCSPPLTVLFTIDSNLDYWLQSPWLTVNSLTDCTFHDSLYSPWLIVLFMIDCTLHNWFNSSWLIALSVS